MNKIYEVLIIDDHKLIIEGYKNVINSYLPNKVFKFESAYDCDSAMDKIENSNFDLIILDIRISFTKRWTEA